MTDHRVQLVSDLLRGMNDSAKEYDVEEIFGYGENRLMVEVLARSHEEQMATNESTDRSS